MLSMEQNRNKYNTQTDRQTYTFTLANNKKDIYTFGVSLFRDEKIVIFHNSF